MTQTIHRRRAVAFGLPALLIMLLVALTHSPAFTRQPAVLSLGITVDLVLTVPLVYLLLIRARRISRITVVPFFVAGVIIAGLILPEQHQFYLNLAKTWLFPAVEIGVLTVVLLKVRNTIRNFRIKSKHTPDFYAAFREAAVTTLPRPAADVLTSEIAVLYYGFFCWKKRELSHREFSYHRNGESITLLATVMLLTVAEAMIIHVLLMQWNTTVAWVLTGISLYTTIQIFGVLRSLRRRPITVEDQKLTLRYGFWSETTIPLANIASVSRLSPMVSLDDQTRQLSPLGALESSNVRIALKKESTLTMMYGFQKSFITLAFYADDPERLVTTVQQAMADERKTG